ncbi:sulfatase-like hydrolase/transferase [Cohnella nanjingensis]|uniref:Sulfatase-like hydrolase/transferase n=1 Tax=Cohnella nanjingensis TaxID=1387779 RepID=A0A7X0RU79_9BACL|nr:sulfatase-like hydrolase/transferase [Cohnella nanjingensis]MBB6672214.1 sulfatase-like hydrolase/transferase [Cohnella nanjingensis]
MNDTPRPSRLPAKPNFLVLLVDEERYPPIYENPEIRDWRRQNLIAQELLRPHSAEFHRHYIGSTACCPSRATLFTGQYPSLHGVSQTVGIAKQSFDSDMYWLNRNTVPTMGDYFRAAGYQTYYKGKWHISNADIVTPGTHNSVPSYHPLTGVPDPELERLYARANPLNDYGFADWIGPDPIGESPRNSASSAAFGLSGRDVVYGAEVVELIETLDRRQSQGMNTEPWLIVSSFVNPHDIVLYGDLTARLPNFFKFEVEPMPAVAPPPTRHEALHTKPRCQASYRDLYPVALQPISDEPFYRQLYYQLQKNADQQMRLALEALIRSSFYDDTIVIFTSDHGDLLGAHGNLHQKWYCAYEEFLHVPLLIHNRHLFPQHREVHKLTSHVDLLPTMLGLANIDMAEVRSSMQNRFSEARPPVGRNLAPLIREPEPAIAEEPIYFMTDDDVTRGQRQVNLWGRPYPSVVQPNHIETVLVTLHRNDKEELWKFSRYFDNSQFWTDPGVRDVTAHPAGGDHADKCVTYTKTQPVPDEYELYNLTDDPMETRNLTYHAWATEETRGIQTWMMRLLEEQRKRKRLYPSRVGI